MPYRVLPRSTPSSQGVDPTGVQAFLDAMEAHAEVEMHSLMLLRNGHVVAEGWWTPYGPDRVHLLYSLSKSFASTAAGFAVAEGLLDLDRTVLSYFPELDADVTDERSRSILVRHVAAMASGHHTETIEQALAIDPAEPVRGFLQIPPEHEPGSWFAYNQPCTYSLAAIVQRESGQTLVDYLRPRLFDPLGIGEVGWQQHPPGRAMGFSGLHATTDAIAKLGQLYLQRGWWGDRQLLPSEWVDEATSTQVDNPEEKLRPGMTATVSIRTREAKDVVRVPNAALRFKPTPPLGPDGKPVVSAPLPPLGKGEGRVHVLLDATPGAEKEELRVVQIGATDGITTEIVSGLQVGDKVITDELDDASGKDPKGKRKPS